MRKVKLQMQVTVDGFVCGPNGEIDWVVFNWDDVLKNYITELTNSVDAMLMGRVLYQGMSQYWPSAAVDTNHPENEFAHIMNEMPKVVFSKTLTTVEWNARLAEGTIEEEVTKLKQQPGKDMIIYGGASIVSSFIL